MNEVEFNKYINEEIAKLKEQISNLTSQLEGQLKIQEEAQDAMELAWIEKRITDRIAELNQGWTPNWGYEDNEKKYYFEYSEGCVFSNHSYSYKVQPNNWYMKNVEISRIIIDEFKDDLIRWFKR
jgi:hypothetical protein